MLQERIEQIARKRLQAEIQKNLLQYARDLTPKELNSIVGDNDYSITVLCSENNRNWKPQEEIINFLVEKKLPQKIKEIEDNAISILTKQQEPENKLDKFALQEDLQAFKQYTNNELDKACNSVNDKDKLILELFQKLNQLTVDRGNEVLYIDRIKEQTQIDLNAMADKINSLSERVKMLEKLYQEQKTKQSILKGDYQQIATATHDIESRIEEAIKYYKHEINRTKPITAKRSVNRGATSKVRK